MKRKTIRLTESQLHQVIKESVKRIIKEIGDSDEGKKHINNLIGKAERNSKLRGAVGDKVANTVSKVTGDKPKSASKLHQQANNVYKYAKKKGFADDSQIADGALGIAESRKKRNSRRALKESFGGFTYEETSKYLEDLG